MTDRVIDLTEDNRPGAARVERRAAHDDFSEEAFAPIGVDICPDMVDLADDEDHQASQIRDFQFDSSDFAPWEHCGIACKSREESSTGAQTFDSKPTVRELPRRHGEVKERSINRNANHQAVSGGNINQGEPTRPTASTNMTNRAARKEPRSNVRNSKQDIDGRKRIHGREPEPKELGKRTTNPSEAEQKKRRSYSKGTTQPVRTHRKRRHPESAEQRTLHDQINSDARNQSRKHPTQRNSSGDRPLGPRMPTDAQSLHTETNAMNIVRMLSEQRFHPSEKAKSCPQNVGSDSRKTGNQNTDDSDAHWKQIRQKRNRKQNSPRNDSLLRAKHGLVTDSRDYAALNAHSHVYAHSTVDTTDALVEGDLNPTTGAQQVNPPRNNNRRPSCQNKDGITPTRQSQSEVKPYNAQSVNKCRPDNWFPQRNKGKRTKREYRERQRLRDLLKDQHANGELSEQVRRPREGGVAIETNGRESFLGDWRDRQQPPSGPDVKQRPKIRNYTGHRKEIQRNNNNRKKSSIGELSSQDEDVHHPPPRLDEVNKRNSNCTLGDVGKLPLRVKGLPSFRGSASNVPAHEMIIVIDDDSSVDDPENEKGPCRSGPQTGSIYRVPMHATLDYAGETPNDIPYESGGVHVRETDRMVSQQETETSQTEEVIIDVDGDESVEEYHTMQANRIVPPRIEQESPEISTSCCAKNIELAELMLTKQHSQAAAVNIRATDHIASQQETENSQKEKAIADFSGGEKVQEHHSARQANFILSQITEKSSAENGHVITHSENSIELSREGQQALANQNGQAATAQICIEVDKEDECVQVDQTVVGTITERIQKDTPDAPAESIDVIDIDQEHREARQTAQTVVGTSTKRIQKDAPGAPTEPIDVIDIDEEHRETCQADLTVVGTSTWMIQKGTPDAATQPIGVIDIDQEHKEACASGSADEEGYPTAFDQKLGNKDVDRANEEESMRDGGTKCSEKNGQDMRVATVSGEMDRVGMNERKIKSFLEQVHGFEGHEVEIIETKEVSRVIDLVGEGKGREWDRSIGTQSEEVNSLYEKKKEQRATAAKPKRFKPQKPKKSSKVAHSRHAKDVGDNVGDTGIGRQACGKQATKKDSIPSVTETAGRDERTAAETRYVFHHMNNKPSEARNPTEKTKSDWFARNYSYKFSREDALKEQERLFKESASRVRQKTQFRVVSNVEPPRPKEVKFHAPVADVAIRYPSHWQFRNPYTRLGLPSNAALRLVKSQYRKLALIYHPDKSRVESTALKFQAVTEAYRSLLDGS